jgi:uncharacterized protein (DUF2147 family)
MKFLPALLALLFLPLVAHAQSAVGTWKNEKATFQIYDQGGKLFGKILTLVEPNRDGKPKTDWKNPDTSKQATPLIGLVFLKNFSAASAGRWENGTIYDPENGKTYSSFMQMTGNDKIEVRGFIGVSMFGRSQNWVRVK